MVRNIWKHELQVLKQCQIGRFPKSWISRISHGFHDWIVSWPGGFQIGQPFFLEHLHTPFVPCLKAGFRRECLGNPGNWGWESPGDGYTMWKTCPYLWGYLWCFAHLFWAANPASNLLWLQYLTITSTPTGLLNCFGSIWSKRPGGCFQSWTRFKQPPVQPYPYSSIFQYIPVYSSIFQYIPVYSSMKLWYLYGLY